MLTISNYIYKYVYIDNICFMRDNCMILFDFKFERF